MLKVFDVPPVCPSKENDVAVTSPVRLNVVAVVNLSACEAALAVPVILLALVVVLLRGTTTSMSTTITITTTTAKGVLGNSTGVKQSIGQCRDSIESYGILVN